MEAIGFDDLEKHKAKIKRLKGSLTRELLRAISFRIREKYPTATHIRIVQYEDNVYRVWAVTSGKRWLMVCEDNVAPTWTSINLDADIDLLVRLSWTPRTTTYIRPDGVEVHSMSLDPLGSTRKKVRYGRPQAGHVDEGEAPSAQDGGSSEGRHQRHLEEARTPDEQHQDGARDHQH